MQEAVYAYYDMRNSAACAQISYIPFSYIPPRSGILYLN